MRRRLAPTLACALFASTFALSPLPNGSGTRTASAAVTTADDGAEIRTVFVQRGDTLVQLLIDAGATQGEAVLVGRAINRLYDLRNLQIGQKITIQLGPDTRGQSQLKAFSIEVGERQYVEVARAADDRFTARRTDQPLADNLVDYGHLTDGALRKVTVRRGDTIGKILFDQGIDGDEVNDAIKALSGKFDPRRLRAGQEISVLPGSNRSGKTVLAGLAVHLKTGGVVEVSRTEAGRFVARRSRTLTIASSRAAETATAKAATDNSSTIEDSASQELTPGVAEIRLPRGATLLALLTQEGVTREDAHAAIRALHKKFNPRRLKVGQTVRVVAREDGDGKAQLDGFSIGLREGAYVQVSRTANGRYVARRTSDPLHTRLALLPIDKPRAYAWNGPDRETAQTQARAGAETRAVIGHPAATLYDRHQANATYVEEEGEPRNAARTVRVRRGDTLAALLRKEGVERDEVDRAIRALRSTFNPRRLRAGQDIALLTDYDDHGAVMLEGFSIELGKNRHIEVVRSDEGEFETARVTEPSFVTRIARQTDESTHTNWDAATKLAQGVATRIGQGQTMLGAVVAAAAPIPSLPVKKAKLDVDGGETGEHTGGWFSGGLVRDAMAFPPAGAGAISDGLVRKTVNIRRGDTLSVALTRAGSGSDEADAVISAFREVHNPRSLQIGQILSLTFEPVALEANGDTTLRLSKLALDVAPDRNVLVQRSEDGSFRAREVERPLSRSVEKSHARITSSLYVAAVNAGLPADVLMELVHMFSFDVDFQREIKRGDSFEVLYERVQNERGQTIEHGPILYAELSLSGTRMELYRFEPSDGPVDYFGPDGRSVRKALMRTPINGARLSSRYGMRKHPILGYTTMHRGVDFAAPRGTPIVAAGDGVIEKLGRLGGYGKYIRIRHNATYKTAYAHMKGYARGLRVGSHVRQGQVIGYVGTTGRSTGPHLHYEVLRDDKQINPLNLRLPTGQQLKGGQLASFQAEVRKMRVMLAEAPSTTQVARK